MSYHNVINYACACLAAKSLNVRHFDGQSRSMGGGIVLSNASYMMEDSLKAKQTERGFVKVTAMSVLLLFCDQKHVNNRVS